MASQNNERGIPVMSLVVDNRVVATIYLLPDGRWRLIINVENLSATAKVSNRYILVTGEMRFATQGKQSRQTQTSNNVINMIMNRSGNRKGRTRSTPEIRPDDEVGAEEPEQGEEEGEELETGE